MLTEPLIEEYRRARESLLAMFPELADDPDCLADTLDGTTEAGDVIARFIRDAREDEAMASALGTMLKDMGERKARLSSRADKRRSIALALLNAIGQRRLDRPDFSASIRVSPRKVEITDETALPDALCKITRSPDKAAIKTAIEQGQSVNGAALGNGTEILTIRTK